MNENQPATITEEMFISWEIAPGLLEIVKMMSNRRNLDKAHFSSVMCGVYDLSRDDSGLYLNRTFTPNPQPEAAK